MRRGIWLIDASLAFIIILVTMQLCLLWMGGVVDAAASFHGTTERQFELLTASDRLINDPKCLAAVDQTGKRTLPQTIDPAKLAAARPGCNMTGVAYGLASEPTAHGSLVVRRLVFLDAEGGEPHLLEVW